MPRFAGLALAGRRAPIRGEGTIRTRLLLENSAGNTVETYDVKTGERGLAPSRVSELRSKTRTGPQVPVIELHLTRGVSLKCKRVFRPAFSTGPYRFAEIQV